MDTLDILLKPIGPTGEPLAQTVSMSKHVPVCARNDWNVGGPKPVGNRIPGP